MHLSPFLRVDMYVLWYRTPLKGSVVSCEMSRVAALLLRYETRVEYDVWMSS